LRNDGDEGEGSHRRNERDEDEVEQDEGTCWISRYIQFGDDDSHGAVEVRNFDDSLGRILELTTGKQDHMDWEPDTNIWATGPLESGDGERLEGAHALLGDVFFGAEWPSPGDLSS